MIELSHSQIENYIQLLLDRIDTQVLEISRLKTDIWKLQSPEGSICPLTGYRDDGKPGTGTILKKEYDDAPTPAWVATLTPAEKIRAAGNKAKAKLRRRKK